LKIIKQALVFVWIIAAVAGMTVTGALAETPGAANDPGAFDPFMRATLLSGPTTWLPWANDPAFIEAREKNGNPMLMGAYKTVLKDPLPGEEANVHLAARYIRGTVVGAGKVFSQNSTAGPYTADRGYSKGPTYAGATYIETIGGGVCKIASTLFNVVMLSDLQIVERHTHGMPVPYVPYGQDATVAYGAKDFKFKNSMEAPLLVWAEGIDNVLYIAIYGKGTPPTIEWHHEVQKVIKAPVTYHINRSLPENSEKVSHEGMEGAVVRSWVTRTYPDGKNDIRELGTHYYNPLPWVIERNK
jgi:vancomycin resistance protein YoaR